MAVLEGPNFNQNSKRLKRFSFMIILYIYNILFQGLMHSLYLDMTFCFGAKALALAVLKKIHILSLESRSLSGLKIFLLPNLSECYLCNLLKPTHLINHQQSSSNHPAQPIFNKKNSSTNCFGMFCHI